MSARVFKSRQNPCSLILGLHGSWLPSRFFLVLPSWPTGCLVAMRWPDYGMVETHFCELKMFQI